jgi:hypothetical protein
MLITKTNPVGIDVPVKKFQTFLHGRLKTAWSLETDDPLYRCYGRCYRNQTSDGYIAENYEGENNYKEVYLDDALKAISFFGIGQRLNSDTGKLVTDVHLVFFVNLASLKASITHRADEEVKRDVLNACDNGMFGFTFESIETGLQNVLREYPGSRRDDRLKFVDMQPKHCFRLNFSLNYNINVQDC